MAESDSTTPLHNRRTALDLYDSLNEKVGIVAAIMDIAKVLSALESVPSHIPPNADMTTGGGWANGYELVDDSLPTLLHHGMKLAYEMKNELDEMWQSRKALEANHG